MDYSRVKKQVKTQFALLLGVGLPVGVIAGLAAASTGSLEKTGEVLVWGYLSLAVFLSAALAGSVWLSVDNELVLEKDFRPREVYRALPEALTTTALSGVLGLLGATVSYFFPGQGFPMILRGYEGASVLQETLRQLGWGQFFLVMAIIVLVGALSALWAYRRVKNSYY